MAHPLSERAAVATGPRLVSLVPSVTEILFALGAGERVVGVSHQCRYPPEARRLPALTRSRVPLPAPEAAAAESAALDAAYSGFRAAAGSPYALDAGRLAELRPDVIFDQGICDVCAIGQSEVETTAELLPHVPQVVTISAATLAEILESILVIGRAAGAEVQAARLVEQLRARIDMVQAMARRARVWPRVACLEWLDPIWCAGHWVPEMVELAGGYDRLGQAGAPSQRCRWEQLLEWAPEVLVLIPCSFSVRRTLSELHLLASRPGWASLPAVQQGRIWIAESGYFSHHSHRTIEGLEMLAHAIHPELFPNRWAPDELLCLGRPEEPEEGQA